MFTKAIMVQLYCTGGKKEPGDSSEQMHGI